MRIFPAIFFSAMFFSTIMAAMTPMIAAAAPELAIGGYDPTAYFTDNQPIKGSAQHKLIRHGKVWLFASARSRELFQSDPKKYSPQYNGWCAYAISSGYVAEIDPISGWTIDSGKLYLNWNRVVKYLWRARKAHHIQQADKNWPDIDKKLAAGQIKINRK